MLENKINKEKDKIIKSMELSKKDNRNYINSTSNNNSDINHISDSKHKCNIWGKWINTKCRKRKV